MSYHVSILTKAEDDEGNPTSFEFSEVDEHNYVGNWVVVVLGTHSMAFPNDGILQVITKPSEEKEATLVSVDWSEAETFFTPNDEEYS